MYIDAQSMEVGASWANLLRKRYPRTSFANKLDDDLLANMGIHAIQPASRKVGVKYIEHDPQLIDGVWTEVLEVK